MDESRKSHTNPILLVLLGVAIAAAIGGGMYFVQVRQPAQASRELNGQIIYNLVGLKDAQPLRLADKFKDADGDLVADPADPGATIDPPRLSFSFVGSNEAESNRLRGQFKEFSHYLQEKVGKPVDFVPFKNPDAELKAFCDGKLQIAGINTGNIPTAVDQCGFVPFCSLASDKEVAKYQMLIIVPADSPMQTMEDLRGHELTLTEPGSNSGFKAPLVLLHDENLMPGQDFTIRYSGGHEESIQGIANKTYQAAAVASDVLQRAMAEDPPLIKKDQYRVIFKSNDFPTAGFGYVWNLKPELAAKIKDAFFSFQWKGTGVEREFAASNQTKFAPIEYKNDFALVRRIDNEIRSVHAIGESETDSTTQPDVPSPPATSTAPAAH